MIPTILLGIVFVLAYLLFVEIEKQNPRSSQIRAHVNQLKQSQKSQIKVKHRRVPVIPPKRSKSALLQSPETPPSSQPPEPSHHLIFKPSKPRPHVLQRKLLSLLHGDRKTAERLLRGVKENNPERDEDWYFEKVIFDLTRDRH
jgi:hypothetical protein